MIIANPIYDVVFKYLLEDADIARDLLSTILGEELVYLEFKPQETSTESSEGIKILRLDFKATIKKKDGTLFKVLIELQKSKQVFDVMRFRRYLGDNYRKEDQLVEKDGLAVFRPLPIITIYFLGFLLNNVPSGVIKVKRQYVDAVTEEILGVKDDFVELLTHDSYMIQVGRLPKESRGKLDRVMQIFSPKYQNKADKHLVDFQGDIYDPLVLRMVERLSRAIASDEYRDKMDVEDEIDRIFERELGKKDMLIAQKDKLLNENVKRYEMSKKQVVNANKRTVAEKKRTVAEKKRTEAEKKRTDVEIQKNTILQKEIAALKRQLNPG
ncbi:MAG: hypothetical protein ACK5ZX_07480 [Bacteroidota bacterium]